MCVEMYDAMRHVTEMHANIFIVSLLLNVILHSNLKKFLHPVPVCQEMLEKHQDDKKKQRQLHGRVSFKKDSLVYLKGKEIDRQRQRDRRTNRQTQREKEIFILCFSPKMAPTRLKLGARNSVQGVRALRTRTIFSYHLKHISMEVSWKQKARKFNLCSTGCQHCKWQLNALCHRAHSL